MKRVERVFHDAVKASIRPSSYTVCVECPSCETKQSFHLSHLEEIRPLEMFCVMCRAILRLNYKEEA